MAKDRARALKKATEIIDEHFKKCPITKRKALFRELEAWADNDLSDEARDIFIEALYSAESTYETRLVLAVEKAVSNMK